jgi:organic radical activating enzyme
MGLAHRYRLIDGKISNSSCEINVAEHCNLSCRGCSHLSPVLPKRFVEPDDVHGSLSLLARHYHADQVRLVGGEPLLHPDLTSVIKAVRTSGVTERVVIVTNGLLLSRMDPEVWQAVDEIEISMYPGHNPNPDQLARFESLAHQHAVGLFPTRVSQFRESYTELANDDPDAIRGIFDSCKIIHQWRCHTVAEGMFFRCPQSYFLPKVLTDSFADPHVDGLRIDESATFGARLLAYLNDSAPLAACTHCLGTAGTLVDHQQVRRVEFRATQDRPAASMISERQLHARLAASGRMPTSSVFARIGRAKARWRRRRPTLHS